MLEPEALARYTDVPVELAAELGRTTLTVRDILQLERNGIIRLSRAASENLDLRIGGALAGRGEIVVSGDSVAIRIGELREEA